MNNPLPRRITTKPMWKKLSIDQPKAENRYKVRINKGAKQFEDSLYWTGQTCMWEDMGVDYWFDKDEKR